MKHVQEIYSNGKFDYRRKCEDLRLAGLVFEALIYNTIECAYMKSILPAYSPTTSWVYANGIDINAQDDVRSDLVSDCEWYRMYICELIGCLKVVVNLR